VGLVARTGPADLDHEISLGKKTVKNMLKAHRTIYYRLQLERRIAANIKVKNFERGLRDTTPLPKLFV
jgi:hypothetical protein